MIAAAGTFALVAAALFRASTTYAPGAMVTPAPMTCVRSAPSAIVKPLSVRAVEALLCSSIHSLAGSFANGSYITSVMRTSPCVGFGADDGVGLPASGPAAVGGGSGGGSSSSSSSSPSSFGAELPVSRLPASRALSPSPGDGDHAASTSGSDGSLSGATSPMPACAQPQTSVIVTIGAQASTVTRRSEQLMNAAGSATRCAIAQGGPAAGTAERRAN